MSLAELHSFQPEPPSDEDPSGGLGQGLWTLPPEPCLFGQSPRATFGLFIARGSPSLKDFEWYLLGFRVRAHSLGVALAPSP
jgi:hypothetical protein